VTANQRRSKAVFMAALPSMTKSRHLQHLLFYSQKRRQEELLVITIVIPILI